MNRFAIPKLWFELTNPRVVEDEQVRQEYLTRIIFDMVSGGLLLMTVIVLVINYGLGDPSYETNMILVIMDSLALGAWFLIKNRQWRLAGFILPLIFLSFSGFMIFTVGPVTTAVLQLAISVLLAGMLSGNRARWLMVFVSLAVYLLAGWASGERNAFLFLSGGITLSLTLCGIASLEWFFSNLLHKSLRTVSEREAKLQSIFRAAPIGIGMVVNRVIQEANNSLCQMTGYTREELIGKSSRLLYPSQEDYEFVGSEKYRQIREQDAGTVETRWLRKDGVVRDILLSSVPIDPHNLERGVTFSALDITERRQAYDEQKALLKEKEVLLAEVHHRVKNNMQIIMSLLNLQAEEIGDSSVQTLLDESRNRIHSMALVHEQLYHSGEYASIDFAEYIAQLTSSLFSLCQVNANDIKLRIAAGDVKLNLEQAIPCGLLLNELFTNSLKYAFPQGKKGEMWVELYLENGHLVLRVGDNGVGLPAGFELQNIKTLGLQLVNLLVVHDLQGKIECVSEKGTEFRIVFPCSIC